MTAQDRYRILPIPGAFAVVDTAIAGGHTVEVHADRARAERALDRVSGTVPPVTGEVQEARAAMVLPEIVPADADRARLEALLDSPVRAIRPAVKDLSTAELLQLRTLEEAGAARGTVLEAIDRRLA